MIYTDSDLLDPVIYARLMQDVACIEAAVARRGDAIPHNRVIVIEVIYDDDSSHDKISTFYYLVDHTNRSIFYLHEMTVERLVTHDGAKAKSLSNLGTLMTFALHIRLLIKVCRLRGRVGILVCQHLELDAFALNSSPGGLCTCFQIAFRYLPP